MNDLNQHYRDLLGLDVTWRVDEVDLDLDGVDIHIRIAIVMGDISTCIGMVARDGISLRAECLFEIFGDICVTAFAKSVSQNDICAFLAVGPATRHGMTINQHGAPKLTVRTIKKACEVGMIGAIKPLNPVFCLQIG